MAHTENSSDVGQIVRHVKVDRSRTPEQALKATLRRRFVNDSVVASMPRGEVDEEDIYFFRIYPYVIGVDLEKEYDLRGFKPAGPYALSALNEDDPSFADTKPNATYWKDSDGKMCYLAFSLWRGERSVGVVRSDGDWRGYGWFAGILK